LKFDEKRLKYCCHILLLRRVFTDISKIQDKVGDVFVIYGSIDPFTPIAEFSFQLPEYATVYQAELVAMGGCHSIFFTSSYPKKDLSPELLLKIIFYLKNC